MKHNRIIFASGLLGFALAGTGFAQETPGGTTSDKTVTEKVTTIRETETRIVEKRQDENKVRTVAIFIKNRAAASGVSDEKVSVLEDFLTSKLTDKGLRVIAREDALNAVASFADAGPNKGDASQPGAKLDAILSNNTSAVRLAQNLNCDYLLIASITTYGNDVLTYEDNGISTIVNESKMNVSYKLLDAAEGGSLTGDVIEVTKKDRAQAGQSVKRDMVNNLLSDVSSKLADKFGAKLASDTVRSGPVAATELVDFNVTTSIADLTVPEVSKTPDGEYVVGPNRYTVQAMAVTVAVDGITVGTAPGPLQALPGLHKIRMTREGFKDWEQTINIRKGLNLNVAMQMTEAGFQRWHDTAAFLQNMKSDEKVTDASVKVLQGYAQMLQQSGFKVDVKKDYKEDSVVDWRSDVKSNTTESGPQQQRLAPTGAVEPAPGLGPFPVLNPPAVSTPDNGLPPPTTQKSF